MNVFQQQFPLSTLGARISNNFQQPVALIVTMMVRYQYSWVHRILCPFENLAREYVVYMKKQALVYLCRRMRAKGLWTKGAPKHCSLMLKSFSCSPLHLWRGPAMYTMHVSQHSYTAGSTPTPHIFFARIMTQRDSRQLGKYYGLGHFFLPKYYRRVKWLESSNSLCMRLPKWVLCKVPVQSQSLDLRVPTLIFPV